MHTTNRDTNGERDRKRQTETERKKQEQKRIKTDTQDSHADCKIKDYSTHIFIGSILRVS